MYIPKQNRDLRHYVLRRDVGKLFLYALWILSWCMGALAYNLNHQTYPPERRLLGWRLALWIVAAVIVGFFLFRIHSFFLDRDFIGTLESVGLSHTYTGSRDPGAFRSAQYDFRLHKVLTVRLENGKKKRVRVEEKQGSYVYYRIGDRLIGLHGLPYPINLDSDEQTGYACAACGRVHKEQLPHCDQCGLSFLDPAQVPRTFKK
ncbi:MAG: hypothetical protein IIW36_02745 [Clostridia bacterium]|nr:hypothetical protein [Clostridia bacterium]